MIFKAVFQHSFSLTFHIDYFVYKMFKSDLNCTINELNYKENYLQLNLFMEV